MSAKGIVYGIGVGPGDPELMTLKACRLIRESDVIAVSGKTPQDSVAFGIASAAVPEISGKETATVDMPMVKERCELEQSHRKAADTIEKYLDEGKNVVYLTLGDPAVYCSFSYIRRLIEEDGYTAETVSGVPSFCAAAARLGVSLADWDEPLHIMPALYMDGGIPEWPGNYVLMKSGRRVRRIMDELSEKGMYVKAVQNCGMENEKIYEVSDDIPDNSGYFTLIIAKEKRSK